MGKFLWTVVIVPSKSIIEFDYNTENFGNFVDDDFRHDISHCCFSHKATTSDIIKLHQRYVCPT